MDLNEIVAISGKPGLYRVVSTKNNGMIAEDLKTGDRNFYSVRLHQFSPLGSVGVYTYGDVIPLPDVFEKMKASPPPSTTMTKSELREYFLETIPDHDVDKVYVSDIKKIVNWYFYLSDQGMLDDDTKGSSEEE